MDPIHKALHYRKTQARALVRVAGGIHWLHCLGNVRDTNAFIRYGNAHIGLVDNIKEPKKVEMALWKIIPPQEGSDFCHRLVDHGRAVCTARTTPYCERCCLRDVCRYAHEEGKVD